MMNDLTVPELAVPHLTSRQWLQLTSQILASCGSDVLLINGEQKCVCICICTMLSVAIETSVNIGHQAENILSAYNVLEKVTGIRGVHEQC